MNRWMLAVAALSLAACSSGGGGDPFAGYDIPVVRDWGGVVFADAVSRRDLVDTRCTGPEDCPVERPYCNGDTGQCLQCLSTADCDGNPCLNGFCSGSAVPCNANTRSCIGDEVLICGADGFEEERINCAPNTCVDGECVLCRPGSLACEGNRAIRCKDEADGYEVIETCTGEGGCYQGMCIECHPGTGKCEEGVAYRCGEDGSEWLFQDDCGARGEDCKQGNCMPLCGYDPKTGSNAGCDFYAVDLENAYAVSDGDVYDAQNAQFAVIVSNTSREGDAEVTIRRPNGIEDKQTVAPLSLATFRLPSYYGLSGSGIGDWAYRVTSTRPVTVYQFNPLSNEDVFSNDASVLMPSPAAGTEYYVASMPDGNPFRGYFTVIAVGTGSTTVTVTSTVNTLSGGARVPALRPGVPHDFVLQSGEVLNVASDELSSLWNNDISGTHIEADKPVIVFGGHIAATTPGSDCCADHLEQQLLPVSRWGTQYVAGRSFERNGERDRWMILVAEDGTQVSTTPLLSGFPRTLNAGEPHRFDTAVADFVVSGDKPLMLVQYLASSGDVQGLGGSTCSTDAACPAGHTCVDYGLTGYCEPIGDPSMILAVPTAQYRKSYIFLSPDSYYKDYVTIVAPVGVSVQLDQRTIDASEFRAIPPTGWAVHRTLVADGVHSISADQKIGIMVHGYDDDVSYGYPGGMGLEDFTTGK